jgi:hypothetical protein
MGKHKDLHGQSRVSKLIQSKGFTKVASFVMDALPIPNIINYLPDRNGDGKRDFKDFKWYELAGSVAVLAMLVKIGVINIDQVIKLLNAILPLIE